MLAPSVQILPIPSIHRLVLLSYRTIIGDPVCAGFARTGVQAGDQQFRFVTILRMAQRRQAQALVTGFRIDSGGTNPLIPVFRESRISATESSCARPFCSQKPKEHAATK
jgi:hypothetical protein